MKILKLLNNKNLSIIIISLLLSFSSIAEEKPVDIWNLDKKETKISLKKICQLKKMRKHLKAAFIKCNLIKKKNL